jgi:hypothetical protein
MESLQNGVGEQTFPSTLSMYMLQLASHHRICIVNTFYRKDFVSFALPTRSWLMAAARLSQLGP